MAPLYARRLLYSHKQLAIVQIGIEYFHNSIYSCFPVLPTLSIVQCTNTISFYCYTLLHPVAWAILDTQTLCNLLQFNTLNKLQQKLGILLCWIAINSIHLVFYYTYNKFIVCCVSIIFQWPSLGHINGLPSQRVRPPCRNVRFLTISANVGTFAVVGLVCFHRDRTRRKYFICLLFLFL